MCSLWCVLLSSVPETVRPSVKTRPVTELTKGSRPICHALGILIILSILMDRQDLGRPCVALEHGGLNRKALSSLCGIKNALAYSLCCGKRFSTRFYVLAMRILERHVG